MFYNLVYYRPILVKLFIYLLCVLIGCKDEFIYDDA
jgi:hypothetical protein